MDSSSRISRSTQQTGIGRGDRPGTSVSDGRDQNQHRCVRKAEGAVLQQCLHGVWTPISFFPRKILPAEKKYSTFDKELLAVYLAVKNFRYFIVGWKFAIFTDHKPLTFVFNTVSDKWSPRQQRHLCFVSEFTTDIRYVRGADNVVADELSRAPPQEFGTVASTEGV